MVKNLAILTCDSPKLLIILVNTALITEFNLQIHMLRFPKGVISGARIGGVPKTNRCLSIQERNLFCSVGWSSRWHSNLGRRGDSLNVMAGALGSNVMAGALIRSKILTMDVEIPVTVITFVIKTDACRVIHESRLVILPSVNHSFITIVPSLINTRLQGVAKNILSCR